MAEHAVQLKLPTFWSSSPVTWFHQAEAQFALRNITVGATRYYYLVAALDQDTAQRLSDLLDNPPENGKYDQLKQRLLRTFQLSDSERAARLLRLSGLGDRRPSQLMEEMLHLHGGKPICYLFKELFLQQLPPVVRAHLSDADFTDPRQVALQADRLWRDSLQAQPPISAVIDSSPPPSEVGEIMPVTHANPATRSKRSSVKSGVGTKPRAPQPSLCFYHRRFGASAQHCRPPCAFQGNVRAGHQ